MDWYSSVLYEKGCAFEQGDILYDCPYFETTRKGDECLTDIVLHDVVILTQSCDLAHGKVGKILVAPWVGLSDFMQNWLCEIRRRDPKKEQLSSKDKRSLFKHLSEGIYPGYHILNKCEESGLLDYPIIDFRNAYSVALAELERVDCAQKRILRLRTPYREHLSQAFARFFMRVGLPSNLVNPY